MFQTVLATGLLTLMITATQPTEPRSAVGQIVGRVLDEATREPLAGSQVFLYRVPFPGDSPVPVAVTDGRGDYVFEAVVAGSYRVRVNRSGFFPTPVEGSVVVEVGAGETQRSADLLMSRGGVLAGRLVDESGNPLRRMLVGALRFDGVVRLDQATPSVDAARTDNTGVFRVTGLMAGQYVVVANRRNSTIATAGMPDSVTYFPGVLDLQSAQLLTLGPGATVGGLDFTMLTAPTFDVSGVAADEAGRPVRGALVMLEADWPLFGGLKGTGATDDVGRFRIGPIAAGDYRLTVTPPGVDPKRITRQSPFVRVRVVSQDVSNLVVHVPVR